MAKLKDLGHGVLMFQCPGCGCHHLFHVAGAESPNIWEWNGSKDAPTFSPSLRMSARDGGTECHLFVRDGKIQFLNDCRHALAGKTVEMPEYE